MLHSLKSRGELFTGIACLLLAAVPIAMFGCGGDDRTADSKGIIVQNPQKRTPMSTVVTTPPATDSAIVQGTPEVAVVSEPEPPREVSYEEAETAYKERHYEKAAELFVLYTERKNANPWGFYMLGLSAWKAGDLESAETAFTRALELDPNHVKSHLNLSRVLLDADRAMDALEHIRAAIAIDSESNVAYRLKGRVFHEIGQKPQAIEAYQQAIKIDNGDAWSMNNLGLIYIEEGLFDVALGPLARAAELRSEAMFLNNLGMALERTGRFRAAEEVYRSAVDSDGSYEKAGLNLARVSEVLQDPAVEAIDLAAIAQRFVDDIEGRNDTVVARDQAMDPEAIVTITEDTQSTSDPDSTDNGQQP